MIVRRVILNTCYTCILLLLLVCSTYFVLSNCGNNHGNTISAYFPRMTIHESLVVVVIYFSKLSSFSLAGSGTRPEQHGHLALSPCPVVLSPEE